MSNKLSKGKKNKRKEKKKSYAGLILLTVCGIILIVGIILFVLISQGQRIANGTDSMAEEQETEVDLSKVSGPEVTISVKDRGDIVVQLDEDAAPLTVENFVSLVKNGFYDGLTFHRIIDGFMIQGGDPEGNGTGGSGKTIKGEFSANGVENPISHKRGVISMARAQDMDSADSQFFIVQADSTHLDGNYAGFGYVTSGMEIVDAICAETPVQDANGTVKAEDQPVIERIAVTKE